MFFPDKYTVESQVTIRLHCHHGWNVVNGSAAQHKRIFNFGVSGPKIYVYTALHIWRAKELATRGGHKNATNSSQTWD